MGRIMAVNISEKKGTQKKNVHSAKLIEDWGIENDAHAGKWHRQVSLLSYEKIEDFKAKGAPVDEGAFGENLIVRGIDLKHLPVGTRLQCGDVLLEFYKEMAGRYARTGVFYLENNTREPRTLHAMLIEETPIGNLWILESNIDDCAGEVLGYTMDLLFEAGARDVWFTPIFMKKNRPAYQLSVLCAEDQIRALDAILFRETTTIGVRRYRVERTALPRRFFEVRVPGGTVRIKACEQPDGAEKCYPEYEDVKRIARETGKSYREVYQTAKTTAE